MTPEEKEQAFNTKVDAYNHQNEHSLFGQLTGLLIVLFLIGCLIAPLGLALSGIYQRVTLGTIPDWCIWC